MALQMTETIKEVNLTDAYHKIANVCILADKAIISVFVFKDATAAASDANILQSKEFETNSADNTTYFLTVHATDNVLIRAENYLIDEEPTYSTATQI